MASGVFRAIPAAWFPGKMNPSARPVQIPRKGQINRKLLLLCLVVSRLTVGLVITVLDSFSQESDQHSVSGPGTTFSYQGYLSSGSTPAEGKYDFSFTLNNSLAGGFLIGPVLVLDDVNVSGGQFSVQLEFGDVFDGTPLWLEIGVSSDIDNEPYTFLSPRYALSASPYAGYAYRTPWSEIEGIPAELADGDDDALALLSCGPDQVPKWDGANWVCAADTDAILEAVASMPLYDYNLKSQDPAVRHLGPVAQDSNSAFEYGENDLAINMQDADGLALGSIQALYVRSQTIESENAELTQQLTELEIRLAAIENGNPAGGR